MRLAAGVFAKAPDDLACVQARLDFFNAGDNWLTRQFAIEYAVLFRRLLPVLASLSLPLPLGGTSNHFRADILRKVGGWDPHNVTEDADLGLRLARMGYRTGVIDSETSEEANCALGNWMQQRARWLKGWMQTWLVHMREPGRLFRELGWAGFLATQAWLAGLIFSSLVHPFFMGYTIWLMARGEFFPASADLIGTMIVGLNLAVLFAGYASYVLVAWEALAGRRDRHLRPWLVFTPIYWLLISAAAWLALWQLIRNPFGWNKTRHGLVRRPRREAQ